MVGSCFDVVVACVVGVVVVVCVEAFVVAAVVAAFVDWV